jgi:hypothetical protein
MKTWKIPVTWEMYGYVEVEAPTLDNAIEIAWDDNDEIPLPEGDYINGSWRVEDEDYDFIRNAINDGQEDEEECEV